MRVTIQTSGFDITSALRSYVEQRLATALGWARHHMRKLAVSLSDINGPRGGVDKRCKIQVRLAAGREIIIDGVEADLYAAIDRAVDRADRAVVRQVERTRHFDHTRLPGRPDAPDATDADADADAPQDRPSIHPR